MALNQSTTVQSVMDDCSLHTSLQSYFAVGGITNQPGLKIANRVMQTLFTDNTSWKFNRTELCGPERGNGNFFVTQYGVQDYKFAGACAFVLNVSIQCGGVGIDLASNNGVSVSGGTVTVTTLDPHPFIPGLTVFMSGNVDANYNSTFSFSPTLHTCAWSNGWTILATPTAKSFTFAATAGQVSNTGAPGFGTVDSNGNLTGLPAIGWLESSWLQDPNSTQFPQRVQAIQAVREVPPTYSGSGNDMVIAMMVDYNNGIVKFRLSEIPGSQPIQVCPCYQGRAPKLTSPQSVFPWPDDMSYVLDELALANAYRFAKGITSDAFKTQMAVANEAIRRAHLQEDREASNEPLIPAMSLMR